MTPLSFPGVGGDVSDFRILKCMFELSAGGCVQWQVIKCSVLTDGLSGLVAQLRWSKWLWVVVVDRF
mgnify:FL=1